MSGQWHLAPMSGFCTPGVRRLFLEWGAAKVTTGLIDAEGLAKGSPGSLRRASRDEHPGTQIIQLFAPDHRFLSEAVMRAQDLGYRGIELNMGCPSPALLGRGCGAALMDHPDRWPLMLNTIRASSSIPAGLKCRPGMKIGDTSYLDLYHVAAEEGLDWYSLHPRPTELAYDGKADWSLLNKLRPLGKMELRASGDLQSAEEVWAAQEKYPCCSGFLVGRAAIMRPWIFQECAGQPAAAVEDQAMMLSEMLRCLASELDLQEGRRILPGLSASCGLELGDDAPFLLADRRRTIEWRDRIAELMLQGDYPRSLEGNPFLRR